MNGQGLAHLLQGFQDGYAWVDDMERRKKQDERQAKADARQDVVNAQQDKEFARKEKKWSDDDAYEAEVKEWAGGFAPQKKEPAGPPPLASNGVNVEQPGVTVGQVATEQPVRRELVQH